MTASEERGGICSNRLSSFNPFSFAYAGRGKACNFLRIISNSLD